MDDKLAQKDANRLFEVGLLIEMSSHLLLVDSLKGRK